MYRSSLEQLSRFFDTTGRPVRREDLIALHLVHEWFHHLEVRRIGRTDLRLPRVPTTRIGPVSLKQPLKKTREIAAHAFTQEVMGLSFYPLLLDRLLLHARPGLGQATDPHPFREAEARYRERVDADRIGGLNRLRLRHALQDPSSYEGAHTGQFMDIRGQFSVLFIRFRR